MPPRRWRWPRALGLLLWLVLVTWPTTALFSEELMAAPGEEAATHLWGHTAALRGEGPLHLETTALGWPGGQAFPLIDPGALPLVALGRAIGGPIGGYNVLVLCGVILAGLAGAAWAQRLGLQRTPAAAIAMAAPALCAGFTEGMTEGFLVGLVPLQLAVAERACRSGGGARGIGAALLLAGCAAIGPYNALWAAVLNIGMGAVLLFSGARGRAALGRLLVITFAGLLLSAPFTAAALEDRTGLSGGAQQRGLPAAVDLPDAFRGGLPYGLDLLDAALPLPLTGGAPAVSHTGYLGLSLLVLALVGLHRRPQAWPLAAAALLLWTLSLGPLLSLGGTVQTIAGHDVLTPVGWATWAAPALGRVQRWYRAAAAIGPLLAALAVLGLPRQPGARALVLALCAVDLLLLGPQAWPLRHTPPPHTPAAVLQHEDPAQPAIMELPPTTTGPPPPGGWRDETALQQAIHGKPVAGTIMNAPMSKPVMRAQHQLMKALPQGAPLHAPLAALHRLGFGLLWLHTDRLRFPPESLAALAACLGPALDSGPAHQVFALHAGGCATEPAPPVHDTGVFPGPEHPAGR